MGYGGRSVSLRDLVCKSGHYEWNLCCMSTRLLVKAGHSFNRKYTRQQCNSKDTTLVTLM